MVLKHAPGPEPWHQRNNDPGGPVSPPLVRHVSMQFTMTSHVGAAAGRRSCLLAHVPTRTSAGRVVKLQALETWTKPAVDAFAAACGEARATGAATLDMPHLIAGLSQVQDAERLLVAAGLQPSDSRQGMRPASSCMPMEFSTSVRKAVQASVHEARRAGEQHCESRVRSSSVRHVLIVCTYTGHKQLETTHLLLGLASEAAATSLRSVGIEPEALRAQVCSRAMPVSLPRIM